MMYNQRFTKELIPGKEATEKSIPELEVFKSPEEYLDKFSTLDQNKAEQIIEDFKKDELSINSETSYGQRALDKLKELSESFSTFSGKIKEFYNNAKKNLSKEILVAGITAGSLIGPAVDETLTSAGKVEKTVAAGYALPEVEIYGHHDELTDHVLNYLANKEELPLKDKVDFVKSFWTKDSKEKEKISKMTPEEFKKYLDYEEGKGALDDYFMVMSEFDFDKYKAIWEMQGKYGSPKIRSYTESPRYNLGGEGGGQYVPNPVSGGTIYMDYTFQSENEWLSELAHSKQFQEDPLKSYFKFMVSGLRTAKKAMENGTFSGAYGEEYDTKGSLEYEAHKSLEPELREEFSSLSKDFSSESFENENKAKKEILNIISNLDKINDRSEVEKTGAKITEEINKIFDPYFIEQAQEKFAKISKSRIENEGVEKIERELELHLIGSKLYYRNQQLRGLARSLQIRKRKDTEPDKNNQKKIGEN